MRMAIEIASSSDEIRRSQRLIAAIYHEDYGVTFSEHSDPHAKVERWPDQYMMGFIGGQLVAAAGLYQSDTYVEQFGNVDADEVEALIVAGGGAGTYSSLRMREHTKLVVGREWRQHGLGRFFLAASHSRHFIELDASGPCVLVACGKRSIFENLYDALGIRTRLIKPFPAYKAHEHYHAKGDPMESRLIIPASDIPDRWYDLVLPGEYEIAGHGLSKVGKVRTAL